VHAFVHAALPLDEGVVQAEQGFADVSHPPGLASEVRVHADSVPLNAG
jgi:hypothetical protein